MPNKRQEKNTTINKNEQDQHIRGHGTSSSDSNNATVNTETTTTAASSSPSTNLPIPYNPNIPPRPLSHVSNQRYNRTSYYSTRPHYTGTFYIPTRCPTSYPSPQFPSPRTILNTPPQHHQIPYFFYQNPPVHPQNIINHQRFYSSDQHTWPMMTSIPCFPNRFHPPSSLSAGPIMLSGVHFNQGSNISTAHCTQQRAYQNRSITTQGNQWNQNVNILTGSPIILPGHFIQNTNPVPRSTYNNSGQSTYVSHSSNWNQSVNNTFTGCSAPQQHFVQMSSTLPAPTPPYRIPIGQRSYVSAAPPMPQGYYWNHRVNTLSQPSELQRHNFIQRANTSTPPTSSYTNYTEQRSYVSAPPSMPPGPHWNQGVITMGRPSTPYFVQNTNSSPYSGHSGQNTRVSATPIESQNYKNENIRYCFNESGIPIAFTSTEVSDNYSRSIWRGTHETNSSLANPSLQMPIQQTRPSIDRDVVLDFMCTIDFEIIRRSLKNILDLEFGIREK